MEQAIRKIRDFCMRRKVCVRFDTDGTMWHGHPKDEKTNCTIQGLATKIKNDDQRECHKELVAGVRKFVRLEVGNKLEVGQHLAILLKASESCLAQQ